jgi:DNA-binding helix-hairpin-helix protein with protein kinase domain
MSVLYDSNGMSVTLGRKIGTGGEGTVFEVPERPGLVAKVYHDAIAPAKAAKLSAMAQMAAPELLKVGAWPVEILRLSRDGRIGGLLMPRVSAAREAHVVYSPKQRQALLPGIDWSFLIWVARNVAAAVETVHRAGHVIGDINQKGFLVADNATVRLIDCDSFQITHNGQLFRCLVGVPEFTPPELHGQRFDQVVRTVNHDAFGLSILIFHLLFMGRHPFAGRYQGHGDMPLDRAIRELRFAYSQTAATKQVIPPPFTLPLSAASFSIAGLFERSFGPAGVHGGRPVPSEWVSSLDQLKSELIACRADPSHKYHRSIPRCPWCEIERAGGPAFFISVALAPTLSTKFDFQGVWSAITRITAPPIPPTAAPTVRPMAVTPRPLPQAVKVQRMLSNVFYILAAGAALLVFTGVQLGLGVILGTVFGVIGKALGNSSNWAAERSARKSALNIAERQWSQLVESWHRDAQTAAQAFHSKRGELSRLADEYQKIPDWIRREKEIVNNRRYELQKHAFLDRHYLRDADLPSIGRGLKMTLVSEGFETAADISQRVLQVSGIGPTRSSVLLGWRATIEQRFRFNPNQSINPADLAAIDHKAAVRRVEIERHLVHGKQELERLQKRAVQLSQPSLARFEPAARQLAQAKADASIF